MGIPQAPLPKGCWDRWRCGWTGSQLEQSQLSSSKLLLPRTMRAPVEGVDETVKCKVVFESVKRMEKRHRGNGDIHAYDIGGKSTTRPIFSGRIRRDTWSMPLAFTATSVHADRAGRPKTRTYFSWPLLVSTALGTPQCSPTGFTLHTTQDRGSV
jgi:hypothetical protein